MTDDEDDVALWPPRPLPAMPWERGAPHATAEALAAADYLAEQIEIRGPVACASTGPDRWFPDKGLPTQRVLDLCKHCPVNPACLDYALLADERYGIWAGTTPKQRTALRRTRNPGPTTAESTTTA